MKLSGILFSSLICVASVRAQYFSAGWTPGQPPPTEPETAPAPDAGYTFDPSAHPAPPPQAAPDTSKMGIGDRIMVNIFSSPAVQWVAGKVGVNITEAVERGAKSPWDERIPLITDENYDELIVNEQLTDEELRDRVWVLVVSVTASQNNAISKVVDKSFDDAYNTTVIAGDLPNVRWGRIDYMAVTYLTTKWNIWTGPWIVVITDRGQTLRFYKATGIRLTPELIRELLTEEIWRDSQPWNSNFAPGGKREWLLHYYALGLKKVFDFISRVPRFVLMIGSGAVASFFMRILHRSSPETPAAAHVPAAPSADSVSETGTAVSSTSAPASSSTATSSPNKKAKHRKAGKK
ncbi:hypothetical protein OH76DRAFT_1398941 [Lentinus brumalis]|uniref:Thioredoxin-like fold domain-containing protein n=1 Tax=Lentinus brumalis TaxID=2498619 RepID=A0A371DMQ8_9APHY|nr:hypothetical protein OH76DRAFT_1398941 [Polyporus brumalis]